MLEILHDLAPGAELGFATAFISAASFADNIRALRFDAGCDVIVDDILYFNECAVPGRPDRPGGQRRHRRRRAVLQLRRQRGQHARRHLRPLRGRLRGSGQRVGKFAGEAHDFDPGPAVQVFNPLSADSIGSVVTMFWAEPLGAAASDYDLYVFDGAGNLAELRAERPGRQRRPLRVASTSTGSAAATGSRSCASRGEPRYFRRQRARAAASRPRPTAFAAWATPGRDAAATRRPRTPSASPPRPPPAATARCSSPAIRRTRAGRSRASFTVASCRSASPPTARGGSSSPPTARPRRRCARSRTSRPPTAS